MTSAHDVFDQPEILRALVPSLGFFGSAWADRLEVKVGRPVKQVLVRHDSGGSLDIKGLMVRAGNKVVHGGRISLSSDPKPSYTMGADSGFTASAEALPWWQIDFAEPSVVDQVLIFNRPGERGEANRTLSVWVTEADGSRSSLYQGVSEAQLDRVRATVVEYSGVDLLDPVPLSVEDAYRRRADAVAGFVMNQRGGGTLPDVNSAVQLTSLLPSGVGDGPGLHLEGLDYAFLALLLTGQVKRDPRSRSGWSGHGKLLPTRGHLRRLQAELAGASSTVGIEAKSLTRHGLVSAGILDAQLGDLRTLTSELRLQLQSQGLELLLAYGSLLGHIRDGRLLPHDDDFDTFVVLEAPDRESFNQRRAEVMAGLKASGWNVKPNGEHWNAHLSRPGLAAHIDAFFVHRQGNSTFVPMERMRLRAVPSAWLKPGAEAHVQGIKIRVPAEPERFLADRYGDGWGVVDPYSDWPWALSS